jgi:hypothetical protein
VSDPVQWSTAVHGLQVCVMGSRYWPATHAVQAESAADVHVTWPVQPVGTVHATHWSGEPAEPGDL